MKFFELGVAEIEYKMSIPWKYISIFTQPKRETRRIDFPVIVSNQNEIHVDFPFKLIFVPLFPIWFFKKITLVDILVDYTLVHG